MKRKWEPEQRRRAVIAACQALLFRSGLDQSNVADRFVLRCVLNELVWKYTEAHRHPGKYKGCQIWSKAARDAYDRDPKGYTRLVHLEHVVRRKDIIDALLLADSPEEVGSILDRGETCVVLRCEHADLPKGGGWERYEKIALVNGPYWDED